MVWSDGLLPLTPADTNRSGPAQVPAATLTGMSTTTLPGAAPSLRRQLLSKVPEVTIFFWIIKILCTTVGETFADNLDQKLNLGLSNLTYIMGTALIICLVFQFRARKYVPGIYWLAVVLISVFGTLITDNLTDNYNVALQTTTIIFSIVLAIVFAVWFAVERTLSIHSIFTTRREGFYWLAILFTFALGTAAGDLTAEKLNVGYLNSLFIFAGAIALVTAAHYALKLNAVLAFWLAYILTRPLGASMGDYMSQTKKDGGLALGTTATSVIFLSAILALVVFLTVSKADQPRPGDESPQLGARPQTALEGADG